MLRIKSMVDVTETTCNNPEVHLKLMHNIMFSYKKRLFFSLSFKQKQLFPCFEEFYDTLLLCKIHSQKTEKKTPRAYHSPQERHAC